MKGQKFIFLYGIVFLFWLTSSDATDKTGKNRAQQKSTANPMMSLADVLPSHISHTPSRSRPYVSSGSPKPSGAKKPTISWIKAKDQEDSKRPFVSKIPDYYASKRPSDLHSPNAGVLFSSSYDKNAPRPTLYKPSSGSKPGPNSYLQDAKSKNKQPPLAGGSLDPNSNGLFDGAPYNPAYKPHQMDVEGTTGGSLGAASPDPSINPKEDQTPDSVVNAPSNNDDVEFNPSKTQKPVGYVDSPTQAPTPALSPVTDPPPSTPTPPPTKAPESLAPTPSQAPEFTTQAPVGSTQVPESSTPTPTSDGSKTKDDSETKSSSNDTTSLASNATKDPQIPPPQPKAEASISAPPDQQNPSQRPKAEESISGPIQPSVTPSPINPKVSPPTKPQTDILGNAQKIHSTGEGSLEPSKYQLRPRPGKVPKPSLDADNDNDDNNDSDDDGILLLQQDQDLQDNDDFLAGVQLDDLQPASEESPIVSPPKPQHRKDASKGGLASEVKHPGPQKDGPHVDSTLTNSSQNGTRNKSKRCKSNDKKCAEWVPCQNYVGDAYCNTRVQVSQSQCLEDPLFARFHCCKTCATALKAKSLDSDDPTVLSLAKAGGVCDDSKVGGRSMKEWCQTTVKGKDPASDFLQCGLLHVQSQCLKTCGFCDDVST